MIESPLFRIATPFKRQSLSKNKVVLSILNEKNRGLEHTTNSVEGAKHPSPMMLHHIYYFSRTVQETMRHFAHKTCNYVMAQHFPPKGTLSLADTVRASTSGTRQDTGI